MRMFETVHEMLIYVYQQILHFGIKVAPRGLPTREILGESCRVVNPRARLFKRPCKMMSLPFAIGEFLWYLNKSNNMSEIAYYAPSLKKFSDDGITLNSAYGSRIFGVHPFVRNNQWEYVKQLLKSDKSSRQAIIHIRTLKDEDILTKDHPCTLTLHFLIRDDCLNLIVNMRSNDLYMGSCYDIFSFTMFQEMMAWELGIPLGFYQHSVNSWHLYEKNISILDENLSSSIPMPEWSFEKNTIDTVLTIEKRMRNGVKIEIEKVCLDSCWKDWLLILEAYANGTNIPFEKVNKCYSFVK